MHPGDRFKLAVAALSNELELIKQVPQHPRDRLRRRQNLREVQFIKQQPEHPRDRLQRKTKECKEKMQANDDNVQITKYIPGDIEFMKQQPVHPRDRHKKKSDVQFVKQEPSHLITKIKIKKRNKPYDVEITKITLVHPRERLRRILEQKAKGEELPVSLDDEVEITKVQPVHPRQRLQRTLKQKTDEVKITKVKPRHPRERLQRALRKKNQKISVDKEVLQDLPYFNTKIKVNETNKLRRKEAIFNQIINQLPPNNDTYYIKHNKKKYSFAVKKKHEKEACFKTQI